MMEMDHSERLKRARNTSSKKKGKIKRSRESEPSKSTEHDSNAVILLHKSKQDKEKDRREKLRQELIAQSDSKWSSKKRKRMEKYIDKKIKKEERNLLLENLARSQAEVHSSLRLQTSSSLGTGKAYTHQELLNRLEDKEVRRVFDGHSSKRRRGNVYDVVRHGEDTSNSESETLRRNRSGSPSSALQLHPELLNDREVITGLQPRAPVAVKSYEVGSALWRGSDGALAAPVVKQRTVAQNSLKRWGDMQKNLDIKEDGYISSLGDSSSAYDSSDVERDSERLKSSSENEDKHAEDEKVEEEVTMTQKSSGFKDWASRQLSLAKGFRLPSSNTKDLPPRLELSQPPLVKPNTDSPDNPAEIRGPLGRTLQLPNTTFARRFIDRKISPTEVKLVTVSRPEDVEEARLSLPIVAEEQPIVEAILLNPVVIICGETGSGKTTQVPQFLFEAGFGTPGSDNPGIIGITQPRRVAAMSMAKRVAHELSLTSSKVSYQIRYDGTVSPNTSIKFMTDGVLLRELATDFLLTKYSVIIIDEAHERSINTDILIGVLSRLIKLRESRWKEGKLGEKPLRLIIMSATLRVSDFAENNMLFPSPPPIINVAARQYPVTVHFSRRTSPDYVTEAVRKTINIHSRLPPGGILVFLTGQDEIITMCRKLEAKFSQSAIDAKKQLQDYALAPGNQQKDKGGSVDPAQVDIEAEDLDLGHDVLDDFVFDVDEGRDEDDPDALESDDEVTLNEELGIEDEALNVPMHILPLYSLLPADKQMRVFDAPPSGSRLVVISTNIAETSLTIPGIRYVVDCGRVKERRYDVKNGIQAFVVNWVSKASAAQRSGRAGRTGPGHCYRLYSSALFEHHFEEYSVPEIHRMPIEGMVLQMKSMNIDAVSNFPFPTPPEQSAVRQAEEVLVHLGALSPLKLFVPKATIPTGQITELGKTMSLFPLSPRFSRMLVNGHQHGCLPYIITIVSALSVGDPFFRAEGLVEGHEEYPDKEGSSYPNAKMMDAHRLRHKNFFESQHVHASLGMYTSDIFKILSVVGAYEFAGGGHSFCQEHFVRPKAMEEIHKLRGQISNIVQMNFPGVDVGLVSNVLPPNDLQLKALRQLLAAGFIDQVAVRKDRISSSPTTTQYATSKGISYKALGINEDVFIHPSSVLANRPPPEYVVFNEVVRTSRVWLKGLTEINPNWLPTLGKHSLCTFSKPTKNMAGVMMTVPRFGPEGWELPPVKADILQK